MERKREGGDAGGGTRRRVSQKEMGKTEKEGEINRVCEKKR